MTTLMIDHDALNHQAALLYDHAHQLGQETGHARASQEYAAEASKALMDVIDKMLDDARQIWKTNPEACVALIHHATTLARRTPQTHTLFAVLIDCLKVCDLSAEEPSVWYSQLVHAAETAKAIIADIGKYEWR